MSFSKKKDSKHSTMPRYNLYRSLRDQNIFYTIFAGFLTPLYCIAIKLRALLYGRGILKSYKLPGKCISVGNLTLGGTGKSPIVMEIVDYLNSQGKSVAVLTRGYKSSLREKDFLFLKSGKIFYKNFSRTLEKLPDEAMMYSHKCPNTSILVGANRYKAAQAYIKKFGSPDYWILDDGFQHHKIMKDFNILLFDAESPFGNGHLFPLGSLRETANAVSRADCICFTRKSKNSSLENFKTDLSKIKRIPICEFSFEMNIGKSIHGNEFSEAFKPTLLLSGIAMPQRLLEGLKALNFDIQESYFVEDHSSFDSQKIKFHIKNCKSIITTEKDYYRDPSLFQNLNIDIFLITLKLECISNKSSFYKNLV